ncbi:MAG: serine/threonine-protein kinase [Pseudomonadota bacterium]
MARNLPVLEPDTMVDHFRVVRLLGRGGMGDVYLARDTRLGRKVALKLLGGSKSTTGAAGLGREQEGLITASLNHPHLVTIYASGEFKGKPYLALEYVEGQTLRQRFNEERPGTREAIRIGLAIARAVAEAHRNSVLHRDLKPENILLAKDGRLRVLDFGLARIATAGDSAATTRTGTVCGTPRHLAPEQWRGMESTEASDVWAIGTVLYELVSGRRPYEEHPVEHLHRVVATMDPVPAPKVTPGMPAELLSLVERCLDKNPQGRPPASQVAEILERLLSDGSRHEQSDRSPFRGLMPFAERHRDCFYGREREIGAFLEAMREHAVLPIVGPSGAGKSSFVQAGVIPRLREQGPWVVLQMRPGSEPFLNLAVRIQRSETKHGLTSMGRSTPPPPWQLLAKGQTISMRWRDWERPVDPLPARSSSPTSCRACQAC